MVSTESVKISDLLKSRQSDFALEGHYSYEDMITPGEVNCQWHVHVAAAGVDVKGTIQADVTEECGRCLSPFTVPVHASVDEKFVFRKFIQPYEREQEWKSGDYTEVIDEDSELDLKDLAHQYLIMEVASEPFCERQECTYHSPAGT